MVSVHQPKPDVEILGVNSSSVTRDRFVNRNYVRLTGLERCVRVAHASRACGVNPVLLASLVISARFGFLDPGACAGCVVALVGRAAAVLPSRATVGSRRADTAQ